MILKALLKLATSLVADDFAVCQRKNNASLRRLSYVCDQNV
jgi:hypothetical protein